MILALVVVTFPIAALCAESTTALEALLWRYVDTPDGREADELLDEILRRDRATVVEITAIFRKGRTYSIQPTGTHPRVPIAARGRWYSYALAVPPDYDPAHPYGLVICLHGAGFTGEAYLERWESRLGQRYILACPTYTMGAWWTRSAEELVLATMRDVVRRYHIDPERIFLTGMSNGGIGAWIIGMHHADVFAGIAPMASGIDDVLFPFLANLKHTPCYVIHGAKDQVMPVRLSQDIVAELKKLGYEVVYREHEREHPMAGGHYFPKEELPDLVAWLDSHRRDSRPTSLALVRDATHLEPFDWIRIDATDRIAAFPESLVESPDHLIKQRVYAKLLATIGEGNRIDVAAALVKRYSLFLNDDLIDVAKPLTVTTNGRTSFEGPLTASVETLLRQARLRQDTHRLYPIHVTVTVR
ncbi:hypothetical protein YTPLAS18_22200 [Nitrospira sp.]|nr:hypothetical protein YTPLAS18_22200 [Nitrospira sp.]